MTVTVLSTWVQWGARLTKSLTSWNCYFNGLEGQTINQENYVFSDGGEFYKEKRAKGERVCGYLGRV